MMRSFNINETKDTGKNGLNKRLGNTQAKKTTTLVPPVRCLAPPRSLTPPRGRQRNAKVTGQRHSNARSWKPERLEVPLRSTMNAKKQSSSGISVHKVTTVEVLPEATKTSRVLLDNSEVIAQMQSGRKTPLHPPQSPVSYALPFSTTEPLGATSQKWCDREPPSKRTDTDFDKRSTHAKLLHEQRLLRKQKVDEMLKRVASRPRNRSLDVDRQYSHRSLPGLTSEHKPKKLRVPVDNIRPYSSRNTISESHRDPKVSKPNRRTFDFKINSDRSSSHHESEAEKEFYLQSDWIVQSVSNLQRKMHDLEIKRQAHAKSQEERDCERYEKYEDVVCDAHSEDCESEEMSMQSSSRTSTYKKNGVTTSVSLLDLILDDSEDEENDFLLEALATQKHRSRATRDF